MREGGKMKTIVNIFIKYIASVIVLLGCSFQVSAYTCQTNLGAYIPAGGGTANVYVDLNPSVQAGKNLVVDLSTRIFCKNDLPSTYIDYVSIRQGSSYGGVLANFTGTLQYGGYSYAFPTNTQTVSIANTSDAYTPINAQLYLTPISTAGGVIVTAGSLIASLNMRQTNNFGGVGDYVWYIYSNNNVVVPTGGCNISSRNVTANLPDYPGTVAVPLSIYCATNQNVSYYLTGTTANTAANIFTNTAATSPAQGIGVQISNSNGVIQANKNVSLGTVGTTSKSLGLTASYARTTGQVVAGNVQSLIGVTFIYQ